MVGTKLLLPNTSNLYYLSVGLHLQTKKKFTSLFLGVCIEKKKKSNSFYICQKSLSAFLNGQVINNVSLIVFCFLFFSHSDKMVKSFSSS